MIKLLIEHYFAYFLCVIIVFSDLILLFFNLFNKTKQNVKIVHSFEVLSYSTKINKLL